MMKRRISMLMVLLANMLILAHAVVPHHHNKLFVAIVNILDHDAQDIFNHEHGLEHHYDGGSDHHNAPAHHHEGHSEDCLMSEAEAAAALKMQTDDSRRWSIAPLQDNDDGSFVLLAAIGLYEPSFTPEYSEERLRRRPQVASGHTDFITRSKGLRAPPAC